MQIKYSWNEDFVTLSDEVYEIEKHDFTEQNQHPYPIGTKVRLISGVDNQKVPGYHFMCGFVTVCDVNAEFAQFVGIRSQNLKLVEC